MNTFNSLQFHILFVTLIFFHYQFRNKISMINQSLITFKYHIFFLYYEIKNLELTILIGVTNLVRE